MNRAEYEDQLWRRLNDELNDWYDRVDISSNAQIAFQRSNPAFSAWIDTELVPSILGGEAAASHCLDSIASEQDEVLRHTKFLAAYAAWDSLDAPPDDIAADMKAQGWTEQRLSEHLKFSMIDTPQEPNIFDSYTSGPLH